MAYTVLQLETQIATYLGRNGIADLMQNGQDIGVYGLNSARRRAEQAHDFKLSETYAYLPISSAGGSLGSLTMGGSVTVSGTLSPNAAGVYALSGTFSGLPLYVRGGATTFFNFWNATAGAYAISTQLTTGSFSSAGWIGVENIQTPVGNYTNFGGASGTATVVAGGSPVSIKRVKSVFLPLNSGEYQPIEFLTDDQFISRARMQIGREYFNPGTSLTNLGVYLGGNALCYQLGQSLFLSPSTLSFPITAQLFCVQFLAEYTSGSAQTDWFTTYAPEYLYWAGIAEANRYYKRFTSGRVEGQVSTEDVEAYAESAMQSLIAWDMSTVRGTSTPGSQGTLQPPAPVTPAPASAAA